MSVMPPPLLDLSLQRPPPIRPLSALSLLVVLPYTVANQEKELKADHNSAVMPTSTSGAFTLWLCQSDSLITDKAPCHPSTVPWWPDRLTAFARWCTCLKIYFLGQMGTTVLCWSLIFKLVLKRLCAHWSVQPHVVRCWYATDSCRVSPW